MRVAIIGGGAAGFFSAITVKENYPEAEVTIFEKSNSILAKVKISGGGRCNLTNACSLNKEFVTAYPRGRKQLKNIFKVFNNKDTVKWFEERGVPLVVQKDNCVFPKSQNSQSIVDCFINKAKSLGVKVKTNHYLASASLNNNRLELKFKDKEESALFYDKVIVAIGGMPQRSKINWLEGLNHKISDPVPSLFTFNMPDESINTLMGIVVENTIVSIKGENIKQNGSVLFTHWGMSGPAILKLSSYGARILAEKNYNFTVQINWTGEKNTAIVLEELIKMLKRYPNKLVVNIKPYGIPSRLWEFLLEKASVSDKKKCCELGKKNTNRLVSLLSNDFYGVKGKTSFKEEFVTCGGVSLNSININTMESVACPNLYFAGEILDIDGITGGFNLQSAWSTAYIAGKLM